ncbi:Small subunit processome component 20-like protein [Operophtera brumata]|uniref:Small subunit processome component 20-like protein n=1 Tax=Operophtera brumata TaxID=104452 RepID=A0A0L7L7D7_OPEBR|nr:Small subunit processome component 20-like protein [Operophtera brumata]
MKSKPVKHKTTNTFRFVPFAERINAIDIRHAALYHIEHEYTKRPEENDTHFSLAIQKWHVLNLTENFKKFKRDVFGTFSVAQLVHKKEEVIETLEKILVSLAKDLREDFYPHFPKFLDILIKLLNTKNADQLEWTLVCLAFLFKVLKPYLKKDIAVVLKRIIPLLSDNKPQYINNFAAESFAFVARDIRDKKKFISLVLSYLQTNDDVRVTGKFHSCIETFLPLLLQYLKENKDHQEILFKVLTQTFEDSLQTILPKEYTFFWNSILKCTEDILKENDEESKGLEYILKLAGQVIEHQNGKYLTNPPQFVLLLIKVICEQLSESVLEVCSHIGAVLLLSPNVSLSQEHAGIIVKVLLPLPYPNILIDFVQNVIDYSQFDMHILPPFINFIIQSGFDSEAMSALTRICLRKSPLSKNGIKLFEWVKYPVDFGRYLPSFMEHLNTVVNDDFENIVENPTKLMNVLFCLPHVANIDVDYCINALHFLISKLLNVLASYNLESQPENNKFHCDTTALSRCVRRVLFLLSSAMESAIHISSCKKLNEICDIEKILPIMLPCAADPNYLCALHLTDLYLTAYEHENDLSYPHLLLVDSYLKSNVSSPFHVVRLLTTHIYKLFENVQGLNKTDDKENSEKFAIFSKCYEVESIKPSIQEYRAQISIMQNMTFNSTQYVLAKDTDFHLFGLNYMLGALYFNFKLLWEPVTEFIAGYGNALPAEEFWPPFHSALQSSFVNAKKNLKLFQFDTEIDTNNEIVKNLYADYNSIAERPDLYNYRNLILKVMTNCIQVCEAKNRDVVILFLNFVDEEYRRNENALKINVEVHDTNKMEVEEPEHNIENIEQMIEELDEPKESVSGKTIFKTLINVMQVLAQFKNPRALHKEPIFWELYMDFLKNKNPGLQKYALDCVLNYKNKSVVPYKNNLHNLVDEKKFKDELTLFKITKDAQSIHPDDREHVVPIILRILYGKMTSKLGADKKGGGQARRSLVMRYLAGCSENELKMFIEMAFSQFKQYMPMSPKEINKTVLSTLDLKSITAPGKLHSVMNLFEVVREYFGGSMKDELLSQLFNIFYGVCATIAGVLVQGDRVHKGYVKVLKNLRVLALTTIRKLFEQYDRYPWSKEELHIIFETLLLPMIVKLHIEGVQNPTVLLKILGTWSLNPRYYILLITCTETDKTNALSALFMLLSAPKISPIVVNMVLDMVEKLLTLTEDEEDKELPPIESFNSLPVDEISNVPNLNFGSKILIPHIPSILDIMKRRFANSAKSNAVNKRDLLILSRVTELVASPEICDELLTLLLPILVKKVCMNMAEENMEYAVNTIINLLGHSKQPQAYIKNIAVLFNKVGPVDVRKLLIRLLSSISESAKTNKDLLKRISHIVAEMNAFNKRWIEQPDFDRRIDAYKEIYRLSDNNEIDVDLAILIVNNCFYTIRTEKDIGLRDSAGLCLKRILPKLLMKYRSATDGQFLVRDTVLALISTGIRDTKNENLRNESLALLGTLSRECPDADVVLQDLANLTNKEDIEVDFFENICHLQMHRRVRALMKFCKVAKKMTKCPSPRTLTNFILPLAYMFLGDDKYTEKNTLIDACIEVVSTCCRLLPWYHYEVILKLYLNKIRTTTEHQKQLTRILIGILDAFHFDFSKAKNIELPKALINNIYTGRTGTKMKGAKDKKFDTKVTKADGNKGKEESKEEIIAKSDEISKEETITDDKLVAATDINDKESPDQAVDTELEKEVPLDEEEELKAADDELANEEPSKEVSNEPAFDRVTSVSPSVAKRIIKSLAAGLLPHIDRQEEDMQRVPIALALVKLLQRLPGDLIKYQLPGIFVKLCSFLKSPLKQVRLMARDILKKIMITIGTAHLGILLEHLTILLTRGFQVHVLVATIHTVLDALKAEFKPGDIDKNLHYILDVCTNDLFGALSEEKEVDKLHYKTPEAKPSKKSYVTLMIVSQNITESYLINLLLPFKEVLQKHHSKKIVLKVQEAMMHVSTGLVANKFVDIESLFIFLHGIASESIPEFVLGAPKRQISEAQREKMLRAKPDCFIIAATPKRNKENQAKNVKLSGKANAHVLVEFSLNILYIILKREKVSRMDCRAFVDPLIPLLVDALKSDHIKVCTVAMKCITTLWTIRVSTPTLEDMVQDIVTMLFSILHKYATSEISKQNDNYHLVRNAFKTLLLYAEEDCQNDERQANSFALLKAILEARLVSTELHEVMEKVSKICILSESARSSSTMSCSTAGSHRSSSTDETQLAPPAVPGRVHAERRRAGVPRRRRRLHRPVHFELAAQLSTRFVNVEQEDFKNRLSTVLPLVCGKILLLSNDITDGRFVKIKLQQADDKSDDEKQHEKDHSLIQILNLIERITVNCATSLKKEIYFNDFDEIAQYCQALLAYPHAWVRLKSASIIGHILSVVDVEELDSIVKKNVESERGFIYCDTEDCLRSLILDLCAQFTASVSKDMAEQLVHSMSSFKLPKKIIESEDVEGNTKLNIRWILFKLRKAINVEVAKAPTSMNIVSDEVLSIVDVVLPPLVRELSTGDPAAATPARQLAARLGKKLRRKIGDIEYSKLKAAKRKLQLKEKKKQSKKIKLEMMHGKRPRPRKRKAEDADIEDVFLNEE